MCCWAAAPAAPASWCAGYGRTASRSTKRTGARSLSTLAVIRRETGSWKWMWVTFGYMLALAYAAALITNQVARALGAG